MKEHIEEELKLKEREHWTLKYYRPQTDTMGRLLGCAKSLLQALSSQETLSVRVCASNCFAAYVCVML